ncbi:MAG TPA: hypothetical protein VNK26_00840, partial [Pyrinomonadaceae bacterium]|nr:hypothetical protein [Pyrinomonadaceae bacterium]
LPIVYNTNAYDSVEVLRLLDGIVDIYLPDLKYASSENGFLYSKVRGYTEIARNALIEMHHQMGSHLIFDNEGILRRGLLIRLLVLPNDLAEIEHSARWIAETLGPQTAISLMAQYYPTNKALDDPRYLLLSRRISEREWFEAQSIISDTGLEEGFIQEYESAAHYYRPDFDNPETPFRDIRDFIIDKT